MGTSLVVEPSGTGGQIMLAEIKLPGGGAITLSNPQEISFITTMIKRYTKEYSFTKANDLARLTQLVILELQAFRIMTRMSGQVADFDDKGQPTGKFVAVSEEEVSSLTDRLPKVNAEIRNLERSLKIDKTAREGDGTHDIANYFETLKRAALDHGVMLSKRYAGYDNLANELRWRIRILREADEEDRAYHQVTEASIVTFAEEELLKMEELDKEYAADKQAIWVGKL